MECTWSSLIWWSLFTGSLLLFFIRRKWSSRAAKQRPPGPPGWPLFGNIFDIGSLPHQSLYELRPKYGPIIWLNLGAKNTMVVQSAKTAAQMFKYHDGSFCDRISTDAFTSHGYKSGSLAVGSYGPYWRVLRRLCASELLVNKRINETESLRRKCVDEMIDWIEEAESCEVDVGKYLFLMAFNLVGNLMVSSDVVDPRSKEGKEFFDAMNKVAQWAGRVNIADVWPVLRWLDPQGIKRGMVRDLGRAAEIVAGFMRSRMAEKKQQQRSDEGKKDFLSTVLEFEGDAKEGIGSITQHNAVIIILVICTS